ncbi:hypothetical protein HELRODRAFT_175128 [Helobdella robusta]|uniref:Uncharacterized protein n=1 Tax=Helobdella robusta TaxID=6412 RepID=T1F8W3_HELRO|nr:hypothetical protein HELRODRAFT_175128 [Helobdella robusta]ESO01098.1 hypothetical protein HELRODRAFT_175128 [Helobdella robusta]
MADEVSVVVSKTENVENPFVAEGELSQKADYIISHSTITRHEIVIADPDNLLMSVDSEESQARDITKDSDENQNEVVVSEVVLEPTDASKQQQQVSKSKGASETQSIQVEVGKGNASMVVPQRAEEVKLKKGRKCCGKGCTIV